MRRISVDGKIWPSIQAFSIIIFYLLRSTLGQCRGAASLTWCESLLLILIWLQCHRDLCKEIGSQRPAEHLVGFEPGSFWFRMQRLNLLGHSPKNCKYKFFFSRLWFSNFLLLLVQKSSLPKYGFRAVSLHFNVIL